MFKNVIFYFIALLVILVVGFWNSYFSKFLGDITFEQHFHGIAMLLWVFLLISQAWLIRGSNYTVHRKLGKTSFVLAPIVFISAILVTLDALFKRQDPMAENALSFFWFGSFLAGLFAMLYGLAIYHRKIRQLHSRYMISTALVFLVPGLTRAIANTIAPEGRDVFLDVMLFTGLIGMALIFFEWRKGKIYPPFVVFTVAWGAGLIMFYTVPHSEIWQGFTLWVFNTAS